MRWARLAAAAAIVSGVAVHRPSGAWSPQAPDRAIQAEAMVETIDAYLTGYRHAFRFLVADETYVQRVTLDAKPGDRGFELPRERVIRGEMFLTYLGTDNRWVALHDVATVDGQAVDGRENLRALLAVSSIQSVAARLFRHNARHNIGTITRTFNEPTLVLQVFEREARSRFQFRVGHIDRTAPTSTLVTLSFRERERPTLVRALNGRSILSTGTVVVDAASGAVRETRIALRDDPLAAELATTFGWNERLQLWVPSRFTEHYTASPRNSRPAETISTEARYENYRRFEGSGRVATPQ
jgi:hypothetical protein